MSLAALLIVAIGVGACSKYERMDPTGATKQILYEKPATAGEKPASGSEPPAILQPAPKPSAGPVLDTVELTSGERIEGKVREVSPTTVVIEIAGQSIQLERSKVRTIQIR